MPKFTSALMCPPDNFDIKYEINPWMNKKVGINWHRAARQWLALRQAIESFLNIPVHAIPPQEGLPDMVFATDGGIVLDDTFLKSNFYYEERRGEANIYAQWFKRQGYQIKTLSKECFFEGGDILPWRKFLLAGYGFRTQKQSLPYLKQTTGKRIISLRLVDPRFYHLDTALLLLDEETFLWYPPAFSVASQRRLKNLGVDLLAVNSFDAGNFVLNSLVKGRRILVGKGINGTLEVLSSRGWQVLQVEISEFLKSGGGIHCLVCQL